MSEYGHCDVTRPVYLNRVLRQAGLLEVRPGPFGEQLDLYGSPGVRGLRSPARPRLRPRPGRRAARARRARAAARRGAGAGRRGARRDRPRPRALAASSILLSRAGRVVRLPVLARRPRAPRTTPAPWPSTTSRASTRASCSSTRSCWFPKLHAARRLLQKKLGFRMTFDVVPLDASIVRGSHGLAAADPLDRPILIGHGPTRRKRADDRRARSCCWPGWASANPDRKGGGETPSLHGRDSPGIIPRSASAIP